MRVKCRYTPCITNSLFISPLYNNGIILSWKATKPAIFAALLSIQKMNQFTSVKSAKQFNSKTSKTTNSPISQLENNLTPHLSIQIL